MSHISALDYTTVVFDVIKYTEEKYSLVITYVSKEKYSRFETGVIKSDIYEFLDTIADISSIGMLDNHFIAGEGDMFNPEGSKIENIKWNDMIRLKSLQPENSFIN